MTQKSKLLHKNRVVFDNFQHLFPDFKQKEPGIYVYQSEGFMNLFLHILQRDSKKILFDLSHYSPNINQTIFVSDPHMEFKFDLKNKLIVPLAYRDAFAQQRVEQNGIMDAETHLNLLDVILQWFQNLLYQGYKEIPHFFKWERLPEEVVNQDYFFSGLMYVTQGVQDLLSEEEMLLVTMELQGFIRMQNGVDYLQMYQHSETNEKIYCIDQLSKSMIESGTYSAEEIKKYNHFTLLLPSEY